MNIGDYQSKAAETAIYPSKYAVTYPILGLAGEVGEFANKWKKVIRDNREPDVEALAAELGDILWYVAAIATDMDIDLEGVAKANVAKLQDRQSRNVLGGSGDTR